MMQAGWSRPSGRSSAWVGRTPGSALARGSVKATAVGFSVCPAWQRAYNARSSEGDPYAVAWFDLAGAVPAVGHGAQSPAGAGAARADHRPAAVAGVSHVPRRGGQAAQRGLG